MCIHELLEPPATSQQLHRDRYAAGSVIGTVNRHAVRCKVERDGCNEEAPREY